MSITAGILMRLPILPLLLLANAVAPAAAAARTPCPHWNGDETPCWFLQTNLSERDSVVDQAVLVWGGVFLPAGRDLFGDVLREAHARQIRVIGRFDLSKPSLAAYEVLAIEE